MPVVRAGRLALHALDEAGDRGLDQLVDLRGAAVEEGRHQPELGQGLGEVLAGVLQRLGLAGGLVDHAVGPRGERRADVVAAQRAEAVVGIAVPAQLVAVAEAPRLAEAERAERYPSKSRVRSALSSGAALIRSEPSTTKRQIAPSPSPRGPRA